MPTRNPASDVFDTSERAGSPLCASPMATGTTTLVAHRSYMAQCKKGEACEAKLPGSDLSLTQFLAQCD